MGRLEDQRFRYRPDLRIGKYLPRAFLHGEFSRATRRLVGDYALAALRQDYDRVKKA